SMNSSAARSELLLMRSGYVVLVCSVKTERTKRAYRRVDWGGLCHGGHRGKGARASKPVIPAKRPPDRGPGAGFRRESKGCITRPATSRPCYADQPRMGHGKFLESRRASRMSRRLTP